MEKKTAMIAVAIVAVVVIAGVGKYLQKSPGEGPEKDARSNGSECPARW